MDSNYLESLAASIDSLRCGTALEEQFIEYESLHELLTEEAIENALKSTTIESYRRGNIKEAILSNGRRTFAILISIKRPELIYECIKYDRLDNKLPFSSEDLASISGDTVSPSDEAGEWVKQFDEQQYAFSAPLFQRGATHRVFGDRIRLPFKSKECIGGGGFGTVYKITLSEKRHDSNLEQVLVLKELMNKRSSESMFQEEQRCLEILRVIEHPNVLEMYCSYTHQGKNCFLFPLARGGDLQNFLEADHRPEEMKSDEDVYRAFCGLSSALESLHSYSHKGLNLEMVGCHHDLKPKNILVDGSKFILSDFGLSQMKGNLKDYKTMYQSGEGYYIAPECEDLSTFEKLEIGRPSDIWSFGCILTNALVYLKRGNVGVKEFELLRRMKIDTEYGVISLLTFHAGQNQENPAVIQQLDDFSKTGSRSEKMLVQRIRDMLKLDPGARPSIEQCSQGLRSVAISAISESIEKSWENTKHEERLEFHVEKVKFMTWSGTVNESPGAISELIQSEATFNETYDTLAKIKGELQLLKANNDAWYPLFIQLRHLMSKLMSFTPKTLQRRINNLVESTILESNTLSDPPPQGAVGSDRILMLAAIKHMRELSSAPNPNSSIAQIQQEDIADVSERSVYSTFHSAKYRPRNQSESESVIMEELVYDSSWQDEDGRQFFERMKNVLRIPDTTNEFKALQCRGYYHNQAHHRFALIYRYPPGPDNKAMEQLIRLISTTMTGIYPPPSDRRPVVSLEHRFKLAYKLAESVFEFHKIGWLHKGISSYNIILFAKDERYIRKMESPYMTGFSHSRPDQNNQVSAVVSDIDETLMAYHHPDYQQSLQDPAGSRVRYCAEFDYYSLGLVLMEIGYWVPLQRLAGKNTSDPRAQKRLLEYAKYLGGPMGANYASAVIACLDSKKLGRDGSVPTSWSKERCVESNFERLVLERLRDCSV
ncbi:hypothetical protein DRE_04263 [Drechslerella stenobrocha 248]|uniref:Protein kinase domain-containing protein n=1 Tax=Drechslerella stenobrocha 248 TaxID=1043628 RepID=W7IBV0_9PEZI|nr:hypothetical protein DRE_04263 [Drechslerella stenobrocha 248]